MTFRLAVTYRPGNTQVHDGLTAEQAEIGLGSFARDLLRLEGEGVRAVLLEIEEQPS